MRSILAGIGIVLTVAIVLLCRESILLGIGNYLIVQDELRPADVIHVIAGLDYRTDYGIQLYQQGYGERLFFTGGWCPVIQGKHGERARDLTLEQGVPAGAIAIDDSPVISTYSETVRLREFMTASELPLRSVIVVSDPYHMRRARWTYRQVLGSQVEVLMAPIPFDMNPYEQRWWTDRESREYVWDEYRKIVYYYLRYKLSWGPIQKWLASLDVE